MREHLEWYILPKLFHIGWKFYIEGPFIVRERKALQQTDLLLPSLNTKHTSELTLSEN